uniref:Uncharacterized protein n=1 Tax=Plectus sambesii TaxID=2011161 RepID=A0A914US13_9BILA
MRGKETSGDGGGAVLQHYRVRDILVNDARVRAPINRTKTSNRAGLEAGRSKSDLLAPMIAKTTRLPPDRPRAYRGDGDGRRPGVKQSGVTDLPTTGRPALHRHGPMAHLLNVGGALRMDEWPGRHSRRSAMFPLAPEIANPPKQRPSPPLRPNPNAPTTTLMFLHGASLRTPPPPPSPHIVLSPPPPPRSARSRSGRKLLYRDAIGRVVAAAKKGKGKNATAGGPNESMRRRAAAKNAARSNGRCSNE